MLRQERVKPTYWNWKRLQGSVPKQVLVYQLECITAKNLIVAQTPDYTVFTSGNAVELNQFVNEACNRGEVITFVPNSDFRCGGEFVFKGTQYHVDYYAMGNHFTLLLTDSKGNDVDFGLAF